MDKKILILDNSVAVTGAFKSIFSFSKILSKKFHFHFGINGNSKIKDLLVKYNFDVVELSFLEIQKSYKIFFYLPILIFNTISLSRYIKKNGIRILHVNDIYNMAGILLKIINPDLYLIYHIRLLNNSYVSKLYIYWGKLINKFANRIICVSKIVAISFPFDPKKTIVIYDSIAAKKNRIFTETTENENLIQLSYIGNYIKGKGQDLALLAFAEASRKNTNLRLSFIGGILSNKKNLRFKHQLIKKSNDLGISNLVEFHGPSKKIEKDYFKADIILNFSENEAFSMVCLEALAFGKPLIASYSGGPEEIIDNYVDGILIPNRDIHKMAEAIVELSGKKELMSKFSVNGPIKVAAKYNIHINQKKLHEVYSEATFST